MNPIPTYPSRSRILLPSVGHEPWTLFTSEDLAEELKHPSASSTAVQPLAGSAKKGQQPKVEIMCQGEFSLGPFEKRSR